MILRFVPLALVVGVLALTAAGCGHSDSHPELLVGAVEDAAKSGDPDAKMALAHRAGYRAIVLSAVWTPPLRAPPPAELQALQGAAAAAVAAGIRPIAAVYSFSAVTPASPEARSQFAAYTAALAQRDPGRPGRDRRQRAEPEPLLDAAVRGRRVERRSHRVPRASRGDLRCAQARFAGAQRDRRSAIGTRE